MQRKELEEMWAVETFHWWHTGKRLFMRRLLGDHLRTSGAELTILDVGCGTGANAVEMATYGDVVACDRSLDALGFAATRGVRTLCAAAAPDLPFSTGAFDIVTAFDIIEHVEDDARFLRELERVLAPGGALAIHVPAWPSLWSGHDEVLEHKRRYTRRSLRALLAGSSLRVERLGWSSCAIFPPTAALRWSRRFSGGGKHEQDAGNVPGPINSLLRGVYRAEAEIAATVGLPFGVSLAAIAVKPRA
jgi:SAM-dependent methyltransferase